MAEYIFQPENNSSSLTSGIEDMCALLPKDWYGTIHEEIVRCRDCVAYEPYHTFAGMKLDYGECMKHRRQTNDDRFCWWAERSDR